MKKFGMFSAAIWKTSCEFDSREDACMRTRVGGGGGGGVRPA